MKKITLSIFAFFAVCVLSAQTTVLEVSFENSNGYSLGDINGQNNWISTPDGSGGNVNNQNVSDSYASDGTNSLQINDLVADGIPAQQGPIIGGFYNFSTNADNTNFVAEFDVYFENTQFNTAFQMVTVNNNYGVYMVFEKSANAILVLEPDGQGSLQFVDTGETWSPNTWYGITIELTSTSSSYSINETEVFSGSNWSDGEFNQLRFTHDNTGTGSAYLDNLEIIQENLSVLENDGFKNFDFYTNNSHLYINAENQLKNIEIYSILGKKVATETLNSNNANINIAHLQNGVYLAKVSAEGKTKTFKFIKK